MKLKQFFFLIKKQRRNGYLLKRGILPVFASDKVEGLNRAVKIARAYGWALDTNESKVPSLKETK